MMAEMRGSTEGRHDLTSAVGRGSSWQVEGLDLWIKSEIWRSSGSWKLEKCWQCGRGVGERRGSAIEGGGSEPEFKCWWMLKILSLKNCIRELQVSVDYRWGGNESGGWIVLLSSANSVLEFPSLEIIRPE